MIVTDASAVVAALTSDGAAGENARKLFREDDFLVAPELIDLEVISTIRRKAVANEISEPRSREAISQLRWMPIKRECHEYLFERIWDLRDTVTAYDASYVAIAEILDVPLATFDARLTRAPGPTCEFILLDPTS